METPNIPDNEFWQVKIKNDIYEADLATLKQWIKEGRLQKSDKVKKSNLNWLEAIKVPTLKESFLSFETTLQLPSVNQNFITKNPTNEIASQIAKLQRPKQVLSTTCYKHSEIKPNLFCLSCLKGFCANCLPSVNSSNICPNCQIFCYSYVEIAKEITKQEDQKDPFGFTDLKMALLYPIHEYLSLIFYGAVIGISLLPSIYIILGPIITIVFIFALTTHVIERAETGNLDSDLYAFDLGEMNKNFSSQLISSVAIFLTCLVPYILLQTMYLVKVKEASLYFTNAISIFAPKLTPVAILTIAWAIFYYPLALLNAHVTKSGFSILNPLVGLKIILQMKTLYLKCFLTYLAVSCFAGVIIIYLFYSSISGNFSSITDAIVRLMVIGIPILYTNLVVGGLLGRALYKCQNDPNFSLDEI